MAAETVRTTLALPAELLEATDKVVREGKARALPLRRTRAGRDRGRGGSHGRQVVNPGAASW